MQRYLIIKIYTTVIQNKFLIYFQKILSDFVWSNLLDV